MPRFSFLHGNVSIGYSQEDKRCGPTGMYARADGGYFEPTKLLYPVSQKDYNTDEFIKIEWERTRYWLGDKNTKRVTIFGYGAPDTDVEAIKLLNDAWGTSEERDMEQFEIIDICEEEEARKRWDKFIHSHHYHYGTSYFNSVLASYPRRTGESFFHHYTPFSPYEAFQESNPVLKILKL
jgi:hypothetical protein